MKIPELLSPCGNFEKMEAALLYGADAVYLAGKCFGMRSAADNFTDGELAAAVGRVHEAGKRIYVTVNIMPRTSEYAALEEYLRFLGKIGADAVIVSDIGVCALAKKACPGVEIHISTQASAVSAQACRAWYELGAARVVLARELTLTDIREIRENIPDRLELECFVHGSMCIAYSGRCLLSQYYVGRDANRGACAQPCRWEYTCASFSEVKRPDDVLTAEEFSDGTYIMSSRDTCMIEHIPELCRAGIDSLKIEGRMKSAYYTAVTANAYRMALDSYARDGEGYVYDPAWLAELESVSHREYATGFYFTPPGLDPNITRSPGYIREKAYLATALSDSAPDGTALFVQRNKAIRGERAEMISPGKCGRAFTMEEMYAENGEPIESAPHPSMIFRLKVPFAVKKGDILRGAQ